MKLRVGMTVRISDGVSFTCPFCGRNAVYGKLLGTDLLSVTHQIPTCSNYETNDVADYIKACVTAIQTLN